MATFPPADSTDPRLGRGMEEDVRPVVALPAAGVPWWIFAIGIGNDVVVLLATCGRAERWTKSQ